MRKFNPEPTKSRFNGYLLNAPLKKKKREARASSEQSQTGFTMNHPTKDAASAFIEANAKLSIRSSKERQREPKNKQQMRKEALNRQMTKSTIRKMKRLNTEIDASYQQRIRELKRHVNHLNSTCNHLLQRSTRPAVSRVEGYTKEEKKKYLLGQVCFTEIDQSRICSQQKYLTQFQHLNRSIPKMRSTADPQEQERQTETAILQCLRAIDKVFVLLRQMETTGYPLRSNRLAIEHCVGGRMWLKRVFLLESQDRKDAFSMAVKYHVVGSPEETKEKFTNHLAKDRSEPICSYLTDIEGLLEHLQSSLTQKKIARLMNITNDIEGQLKRSGGEQKFNQGASRPQGANQLPGGGLRLTAELEQAESQWGPMRQITKISRRKFQQLTRSYERLQTMG